MQSRVVTIIVILLIPLFVLSCHKKDIGTPEKKGVYGHSKFKVDLQLVTKGFPSITDIQAVPGDKSLYAITQKDGELAWWDSKTHNRGVWLNLDVLTSSEQGLLGAAFHPNFEKNGLFVLHYSTTQNRKPVGRIELWGFEPGVDVHNVKPKQKYIILEVEQPYSNHNGGQVAFGPDGYLYIGFGDGGSGGDPLNHGQNTKSFLGSIIRIDINQKIRPYAIPRDNPFVGNKNYLPEIWAWGFRNPWRFSFDEKGRLWVADVGQHKWEEISMVQPGRNYGWRFREGAHCFKPRMNCPTSDLLTDPVFEYDHSIGSSITGGYEYRGSKIPALFANWIFGDFVEGKIWALDLSAYEKGEIRIQELGNWSIAISTFGRAHNGEIYIADFSGGAIYQFVPKL